jgi:hypothetical protein
MKPICAYCGKKYGGRSLVIKTVVVEIGQPVPPHASNLPCIKTEYIPALPENGGPSTPDEAKSYVPMDTDGGSIRMMSYNGRKGRRITRHYWDGESYHSGYDPFCTLRCALGFAKASHKAGFRIVENG